MIKSYAFGQFALIQLPNVVESSLIAIQLIDLIAGKIIDTVYLYPDEDVKTLYKNIVLLMQTEDFKPEAGCLYPYDVKKRYENVIALMQG